VKKIISYIVLTAMHLPRQTCVSRLPPDFPNKGFCCEVLRAAAIPGDNQQK